MNKQEIETKITNTLQWDFSDHRHALALRELFPLPETTGLFSPDSQFSLDLQAEGHYLDQIEWFLELEKLILFLPDECLEIDLDSQIQTFLAQVDSPQLRIDFLNLLKEKRNLIISRWEQILNLDSSGTLEVRRKRIARQIGILGGLTEGYFKKLAAEEGFVIEINHLYDNSFAKHKAGDVDFPLPNEDSTNSKKPAVCEDLYFKAGDHFPLKGDVHYNLVTFDQSFPVNRSVWIVRLVSEVEGAETNFLRLQNVFNELRPAYIHIKWLGWELYQRPESISEGDGVLSSFDTIISEGDGIIEQTNREQINELHGIFV